MHEPDERAKLSTGRVIASSPAILLIAVVVSPQVSGLGHQQKSLTITTIALALVGFALYVWCFGRERYYEISPSARTCRLRLRWWKPCCRRASAQEAPL